MILRIMLGTILGGVLGFGYYRLVGCSSGTCPITASPWTSTLFGAVLGSLLVLSFPGHAQGVQPQPRPDAGASASVVALSDANFDQQIQTGVVLVDFWAPWCGPCRKQGPIVDEVAGRVNGKAVVAKLEIDAAQKVASRFRVDSIPTLIVFKDGKPVQRFEGLTSGQTLLAAVTAASKTRP